VDGFEAGNPNRGLTPPARRDTPVRNEVQHLTAHHPGGAAAAGQFHAHNRSRGRGVTFAQGFKGQCLQRIPGQDRQGFAELHMARGQPAAEVVVVHRREVVVDQRIGMDHLDRARRRERLFERAAAGFAGENRQQRP
jgi:hypothetical protein